MEENNNLTIYQILEKIYNSYGNPPVGQEETMVDFFSRNRSYWFYTVKCLGKYMIDVSYIPDLQAIIYGKRQEAIDAYHNMTSQVAIKVENYKKKYNELYEKVRLVKIPNTPNFMYNTDSAIRQQIDGMLATDKYIIDIADNHAKYLEDTVKSIDAIIYAIPNRIRLEEIKIGR